MEQLLDQYSEFYVQEVGVGLYGTRRFLAEAKKIGAQRTILFDILSKLHFGDKVLLGEHRKVKPSLTPDQVQSPTADDIINQVELKPLLSVFAFLRVSGISHNLPEEVSAEVIKRLHVEEVVVPEPMEESRACGSYTVAGGVSVTEDIPEICAVIKQVCMEKGIKPNSGFKFFVRGSVTPLKTPIVLENLKHTRAYRKVKLPTKDLVFDVDGTEVKQQVFRLADYERRMYMKKEDGEAYDRALLDEHRENVKITESAKGE